jgi:hypothetical protein
MASPSGEVSAVEAALNSLKTSRNQLHNGWRPTKIETGGVNVWPQQQQNTCALISNLIFIQRFFACSVVPSILCILLKI